MSRPIEPGDLPYPSLAGSGRAYGTGAMRWDEKASDALFLASTPA